MAYHHSYFPPQSVSGSPHFCCDFYNPAGQPSYGNINTYYGNSVAPYNNGYNNYNLNFRNTYPRRRTYNQNYNYQNQYYRQNYNQNQNYYQNYHQNQYRNNYSNQNSYYNPNIRRNTYQDNERRRYPPRNSRNYEVQRNDLHPRDPRRNSSRFRNQTQEKIRRRESFQRRNQRFIYREYQERNRYNNTSYFPYRNTRKQSGPSNSRTPSRRRFPKKVNKKNRNNLPVPSGNINRRQNPQPTNQNNVQENNSNNTNLTNNPQTPRPKKVKERKLTKGVMIGKVLNIPEFERQTLTDIPRRRPVNTRLPPKKMNKEEFIDFKKIRSNVIGCLNNCNEVNRLARFGFQVRIPLCLSEKAVSVQQDFLNFYATNMYNMLLDERNRRISELYDTYNQSTLDPISKKRSLIMGIKYYRDRHGASSRPWRTCHKLTTFFIKELGWENNIIIQELTYAKIDVESPENPQQVEDLPATTTVVEQDVVNENDLGDLSFISVNSSDGEDDDLFLSPYQSRTQSPSSSQQLPRSSQRLKPSMGVNQRKRKQVPATSGSGSSSSTESPATPNVDSVTDFPFLQ